jgi:hypothetical protein
MRLLDFDGIFQLYVPQRVGLASYLLSCCYILIVGAAGIPTLFVELLYSRLLFFSRDSDSKAICERIGVDMVLLQEFQMYFSPMQQSDMTL